MNACINGMVDVVMIMIDKVDDVQRLTSKKLDALKYAQFKLAQSKREEDKIKYKQIVQLLIAKIKSYEKSNKSCYYMKKGRRLAWARKL
jgi:two-component sensor histidine kinase